ncbi:MAG: class I SAM-dependent methyltransferase [Bacteroidetes bacterium]|nr:class I SAM-dependent methyltransferase [Bacteroidota bacterium]
MKEAIKKILLKVPGGDKVLKTYSSNVEQRWISHFKNSEELFTSYYSNNRWDNKESLSGPGSTIEYTENIRKEIPELIKRLNVKKILDAPCGDYNWFREVPRNKNVNYIGGDIVEPMIRKNQALYKNDNTTFVKLDITKDKLPDADLWICRDCLLHFSYKDIFRTIKNFLKSDIRYLLTTTNTECNKNINIKTGDSRLINLELPPFNFCTPLRSIDDWIKGYPVRKLSLWEKGMLYSALSSNKNLL